MKSMAALCIGLHMQRGGRWVGLAVERCLWHRQGSYEPGVVGGGTEGDDRRCRVDGPAQRDGIIRVEAELRKLGCKAACVPARCAGRRMACNAHLARIVQRPLVLLHAEVDVQGHVHALPRVDAAMHSPRTSTPAASIPLAPHSAGTPQVPHAAAILCRAAAVGSLGAGDGSRPVATL